MSPATAFATAGSIWQGCGTAATSGFTARRFGTNLDSRDRIALFRLAHDLAVSGFGGRQALYERFFFGPQEIMASIYFDLYDKDALVARVEELLTRAD